MDLEMVLNELSLRTPAANEQTARQLMSELIDTLSQATSSGVKRILRTSDNINHIEIARNYPIARWRNDNNIDREERRFFRTLITKAPFWNDTTEEIKDKFDLSQVWCQGKEAKGLGFALVSDALAVSLNSEQCWNCSRLELEVRRLEEDLVDEQLEINHASTSGHVEEHRDWIKNWNRNRVSNGLELWNLREELFPNLIFCDAVREQLQSLDAENPRLQHVKNWFLDLEAYCQTWTDGAFKTENLRNVSPESTVTLQNKKYSRERTFICPDGKERIFSWHAKLSSGWRIYFFPQEQRKIIIGYVGCHLPTVKYSN